MATYTVVSGRLVCTGTDITTQGICAAVTANSGTLTPIKGSAASATFYSSDTGYVNAIIRAELTIGDNSTPSTWVIESQNVIIEASTFLQNKGDLRLGKKRANGTLSFGSRFVFDSTNNAANAVGWERWVLQNGSWVRGYNSVIHSDSLLTTAPSFGGLEFDGCYVSVLDGIGEGGSYANSNYLGQTITYKNCVFDAHVGVGLKLYMGHVNAGITYNLQGVSITNNTYGIQPGSAALVLVDFKLNTNTVHSVPNVGTANVTFVNPDFQTLRLEHAGSAVHRIAYRYIYTALNTAKAPLSGVKVRIFDQQNTAVVNNLLTDAAGKVSIPTYNSIPVLMHSTWAGVTATARATHAFGSISYLHNVVAKTVTATADITDTIIYSNDASITQTNKATVDAYTAIDTSAKLYDRAKSWLFDNYTGQLVEIVTRSGDLIDAGSYNVTIDATAAQAFSVAGNTITIKASTYTGDMTTTGIITLANGALFNGTRTDANGTISPPLVMTVSGYTTGARVFVYNDTTSTSIYNDVPGGSSLNITSGFSAGDTLTIRSAFTSAVRHAIASTVSIAASASFTVLLSEVDDAVYAANGIDGAAVTGIDWDANNGEIDLLLGENFTAADLYAWYCDSLSGALGISLFFGAVTALDQANIRANANLYLDNATSTNIRQTDNVRLFRSDEAYPVREPTSGGGGIDVVWRDKVFVAIVNTTGTPVITGDIADVPTAIENAAAVLTAAQSTPIYSEIRRVNGVAVDGTGTDLDPWGPA